MGTWILEGLGPDMEGVNNSNSNREPIYILASWYKYLSVEARKEQPVWL